MKQLNYITDSDKTKYMRLRQSQNLQYAKKNKNEIEVGIILREKTKLKWRSQAIWGMRVFDWWCDKKGCAVEVDGPGHNQRYDHYRDEYNFRRSAIVVLRVKNGDLISTRKITQLILKLEDWDTRRELMGVGSGSQRKRRKLAMKDDYPEISYLNNFLLSLST